MSITANDIRQIEEVAALDPFAETPEAVSSFKPTKTNKVNEGDDLVGKHNLLKVEISEEDKETIKRANEFVNFFKLRLFQFLMRRDRHDSIVNMPHAIAGGFLSDSYMRKHAVADTNACDAKDIDVFLQVDTSKFKSLDVETFMRELEEELLRCTSRHSEFEIMKYERNYTYNFISIPYIFKIQLPGMPKMEIVLSESLERIFDFDISIRHFFNLYGEEEVYASPIAIQDIKESKLTVVSPLTPKSTLARLFYFEKRYGFSITEHSLDILSWSLSRKFYSINDVYDYVFNVDKFNFETRMHILVSVKTFCEEYKQDTLYLNHTGFRDTFPYHELFLPIYDNIGIQHLHDVLFTKTFPYGFISRFSDYIFSENGERILKDHYHEYKNALDNSKLGWASDLYEDCDGNNSYYDTEIYEDTKEYLERDTLNKLRNTIIKMGLTDEFKDKYFTNEFKNELLYPKQLRIQLPVYARKLDIPKFIRDTAVTLSPIVVDTDNLPF